MSPTANAPFESLPVYPLPLRPPRRGVLSAVAVASLMLVLGAALPTAHAAQASDGAVPCGSGGHIVYVLCCATPPPGEFDGCLDYCLVWLRLPGQPGPILRFCIYEDAQTCLEVAHHETCFPPRT